MVQVVGSRGELQPFIALGNELQKYDRLVQLATHNTFQRFVQGHRLQFYPIRGNREELMAYIVKKPGLILGDCPHEWLFQHVSAVVHHGCCSGRWAKANPAQATHCPEPTRHDFIFPNASSVSCSTRNCHENEDQTRCANCGELFSRQSPNWRNCPVTCYRTGLPHGYTNENELLKLSKVATEILSERFMIGKNKLEL